jgi:hypothetical protein
MASSPFPTLGDGKSAALHNPMQTACQTLSQLFLLINLQANRIFSHQGRAQKSEAVQIFRRRDVQSGPSENIGYRWLQAASWSHSTAE